jgi:hypothetical protein
MFDARKHERLTSLRRRARLLAARSADSLARDLSDEEAFEVFEALLAAAIFVAAYALQHPTQSAALARLWENVFYGRQPK